MELEAVADTTDDLPRIAAQLLAFAGDCRIYLFDGPMGAGKTTLIKVICETLGVTSPMGSPSFSIVNEYESPAGRLCHIDLYRVKNADELAELGMEEYLDSGDYCFIEWPELLRE